MKPKNVTAEKKDWNKESVVKLKQELEERGLSTTGSKAELVTRLGGVSTRCTMLQDIIANMGRH